jgi:hypothetical protein
VKALLISVLALSLAGCTRPAPTAAPAASPPVVFKAKAPNATSNVAANVQGPRSARLGGKNNAVAKKHKPGIAGKMAPRASAQFSHTADPVKKARAAIAALMEKPASAQFTTMRRAVRNFLREPLDTVCGYVRGKNASGGDTGEMPFLYIIDQDEAYLVDGTSPVAETVHRAICD